MLGIDKHRMRKLYRGAVYGFAIYGFLQFTDCGGCGRAHGAELDSQEKATSAYTMRLDKQQASRRPDYSAKPLLRDAQGELERQLENYKTKETDR